MVKSFSPEDKKAIAQVVIDAEHKTGAEITAVVVPSSDGYQSYVLAYGLILGTIFALALWIIKPGIQFPFLLTIQFAAILFVSLTPALRYLCIRFVSKHIRHHRAAQRAYEEYLFTSRHLHSSVPIVLFYVSLAERYAHIIPSRIVREKISDETWHSVIGEFTSAMKTGNLRVACSMAVNRIAENLAPHFPKS